MVHEDRRQAERREEFALWLTKHNGAAHTSDARAAGFTGHEVARWVGDGLARRVRRSWLIAPDCDERRAVAASVGGRLTCVTAAAMRGLVVPDDDDVHVAVSGNASRLDPTGIRLHWAHPPAPVARNATAEPIVNVLFHAARCLPRTDALALWESAIRVKHVEPKVLRKVAWRSTQAAEIAAIADDLSDSKLESRFFDGLGRSGIRFRRQAWVDGRRVDGLVGDALVLQVDGFAFHSSPEDRRRDLEADARLALQGYTVLRFDFFQVFFQWDDVLATIQLAVAQRAHRGQIR